MYLSISFCFLEQSPPQHFAVTCLLKCPISSFAITFDPTFAWMLTTNSCCGMRSLSLTQMRLENSKALDLWTRKVSASMGSPMMWIMTFSILDFQKPSSQKSMEPQPLVMDLISLLKLRMTSLRGSRQRRMALEPYSARDNCLPRLFQHMDQTSLTTYNGTITLAFTICSQRKSIQPFSGHQDAFSRCITSPFRVLQRYGTDGLVIIMSELPNQAYSRCLKIYMCSTPRNPTLKPLPRAAEDSFVILTDGSTKASLQRFFYNQGVLFGLTEQRPANTTGLAGQNPVKGFTGFPILKKVSPILASLTCFMLVATQPIMPGLSQSAGYMSGLSTPTSNTWQVLLRLALAMVAPFLMVPDLTRKRQMTPLLFSYQEFTRKRVSSFQGHSLGLQISCTMVYRSRQTPAPVLALTRRGAVYSLSQTFISQATYTGLALGMSILLITGIILRPQAFACQKLVTV